MNINFVETIKTSSGQNMDVFKCKCDFLVAAEGGVFLEYDLFCPKCEQTFVARKPIFSLEEQSVLSLLPPIKWVKIPC